MPTLEELRRMQCVWEKPQAWVEFERDHGDRGRTPPRGKITEWSIIHPMYLDTLTKIRNNGRCLSCFCKGHMDRDCLEKSKEERNKRCTSCHQKGHRSFDCLWRPLPRTDAFIRLKQFYSHDSETDTAEVVARRTEGRTSLLIERGFASLLGTSEPVPLWSDLEDMFPGVMRRSAGIEGGE